MDTSKNENLKLSTQQGGLLKQVRDKLIDIAAVIVATVALFISCNQYELQKEISASEKQPLLELEYLKIDKEPEKGFLLRNVGFGPAVIKSFGIFLNEAGYKNNNRFTEWLQPNGYGLFPMYMQFQKINTITEGYIVTNTKEGDLFLLGTDTAVFYNSPTAKHMDSVIIEIVYSSLYASDTREFYLRFCNSFTRNNIRNKEEKHIYEWENNAQKKIRQNM